MFCPNCGKDIGDAKFCPNCGTKVVKDEPVQPVQQPVQENAVPKKQKKKHGCLMSFLVVFIFIGVVGAIIANSDLPSQGIGFIGVDAQQSTEEHCRAIADYMDDYLEELGYFPVGFGVEWIGYYKYSDMYSEEEYEELELGGYYSYTGQLSTGEVANADIFTYWEENEEPTILYLNIETLTSENPIVPFDNDSMVEAWNIYKDKASEK